MCVKKLIKLYVLSCKYLPNMIMVDPERTVSRSICMRLDQVNLICFAMKWTILQRRKWKHQMYLFIYYYIYCLYFIPPWIDARFHFPTFPTAMMMILYHFNLNDIICLCSNATAMSNAASTRMSKYTSIPSPACLRSRKIMRNF